MDGVVLREREKEAGARTGGGDLGQGLEGRPLPVELR
jgi:hypothetical protein